MRSPPRLIKAVILSFLVTVAPLAASAQEADKDWRAEAVRKYPELGVPGSDLNKRFIELYRERQKDDPTFLSDPKWPLVLADEFAASASEPRPAVPSVPITPVPQPASVVTQQSPEAGPATPRPLASPQQAQPTESIVPSLLPTLIAGGLVGGVIAIVWGVAAAAAQRRRFQKAATTSATKPEATLWIGSPSYWSYFWSWIWGIVLLPVGVGLLLILGIIISRARRVYIVTGRKVIFEYGILARSTYEVRIKDIRSINVSKRGIAGLLGIGSVEFSSAASDRAEVIFANVANADAVRDIVRALQEESEISVK